MKLYRKGNITSIKLIIWDLDETFWKGTIDDGDIPIIPDAHKILINKLTDYGIINSICSKNSVDTVKEVLMSAGLWDLFVFPSVNWAAKGNRVKSIIETIGIKNENVLFVDDSISNIEEVEYCVSGITVAFPNVIEDLLEEIENSGLIEDFAHERLMHYKLLEKRINERQHYNSSQEFLMSCKINLIVHKASSNDCTRIYELVQRTNQLNFTKVRSSEGEINAIINNPEYNCGTVWVNDRFGDYGMVGFFAIHNGFAKHFLFSCRTLGMGIEQYVYQMLGCPQIDVKGDVNGELGSRESIEWINVDSNDCLCEGKAAHVNLNEKILLIGGCDLEQTAYYLEQSGVRFDSRFNYIAHKRFECHPDSIINLRASLEYTEGEKDYILHNCPFYDRDVFFKDLFYKSYDVVIYSPLIDYSIGLYEAKKRKGLYVVYGNKDNPHIVNSAYMTREEQELFRNEFRFYGGITKEMFLTNIKWLIEALPSSTKIIMLNGSEVDFPHPQEPNRYITHIELNRVLESVVDSYSNVEMIDVRELITDTTDYVDSIRHYSRKVYYQIANEIIKRLKEFGTVDEHTDLVYNSLGLRDWLAYIRKRKEAGRLRVEIHKSIKKILKRMRLFSIAYRFHNLLENRK